jgi:hypothetical protein
LFHIMGFSDRRAILKIGLDHVNAEEVCRNIAQKTLLEHLRRETEIASGSIDRPMSWHIGIYRHSEAVEA